jgi:hypothetical protein
VSGGIAERAKFGPQAAATAALVGFCYPLLEGVYWNGNFGVQAYFASALGAPFKDFAGSVVVHAFGGWVALGAVLMLGPRLGRYDGGRAGATPPSSIPWLALGSWLLCIGWFGFNVMSAQRLEAISGLRPQLADGHVGRDRGSDRRRQRPRLSNGRLPASRRLRCSDEASTGLPIVCGVAGGLL